MNVYIKNLVELQQENNRLLANVLKTLSIIADQGEKKTAASVKKCFDIEVDPDTCVWEDGVTKGGKFCQRAFEEKNCIDGKITSAFALLRQKIEHIKKQNQGNCYISGYGYWIVSANETSYIGRVKTEGNKKQII